MVCFIVMVAHLMTRNIYKREWGILIYFSFVLMALWAALPESYIGNFSITYRLREWQEPMRYWVEHANKFFGIGPGSFEWVSVAQLTQKRTWMHGDWIQILFETGYLGVSLAISFYIVLLYEVRDKYYKLTTLVGLGLGMLVYSPMQFFWCQILTVLMVTEDDDGS